MDKNSKIYIAGHTGLVGSSLLRNLRNEGYKSLVTKTHSELDLTRQAEVESFFINEKPEYVFLAAAKVGGIMANNSYPAEFIYSNLIIQNNIIHSAWKNSVKRLLFLGSSCIYPRECSQPMKEEYLLTGPLESTNEPYAVAKIAGIKMCQSYNRQYGTSFISVMPTNLYGPNDNFDLENSHLLPALIRKFHLGKLAAIGDWESIKNDEKIFGKIPDDFFSCLISITIDKGFPNPFPDIKLKQDIAPEVILWGSGKPKREFLHVNDLAHACLYIMNLDDGIFSELLTKSESPFINIGCGEDNTIKELAELAKSVIKFNGDVRFDNLRPDGTPQKLLDIYKINNLGWKPKKPLREGIKMTYEWYLDNLKY